MKWCTIVYWTLVRHEGGLRLDSGNCKGSFDTEGQARNHEKELEAKGLKCIVKFCKPWNGTRYI